MPEERTASEIIAKKNGEPQEHSAFIGKSLPNTGCHIVGKNITIYGIQRLVSYLLFNNTLNYARNTPASHSNIHIVFSMSGRQLKLQYSSITGLLMLYYNPEDIVVEENLETITNYIQSNMR